MRTHELKIWAGFLDALLDGRKTFEVRKDDPARPFELGDRLVLREWCPECRHFGPRTAHAIVGYVMALDEVEGMPPGVVVMSVKIVDDLGWEERHH